MMDRQQKQEITAFARALCQTADPDKIVLAPIGYGISTPLWKLHIGTAMRILGIKPLTPAPRADGE